MVVRPIFKKRLHLTAMALIAASGVVLMTSSPALSATFNVVSGDVPGLIAAIKAANADGSTSHTINLAAGTYKINKVNNTVDGPNGLPTIIRKITIKGAGAATTVIKRTSSNQMPMRLFHVSASGGNLTLVDLTVTNGLLTSGAGGGIYNAGILTLTKCTVNDNHICELEDWDADGKWTCSWIGTGPGGGLANRGSAAINDTTISNNSASYGGGIDSPSQIKIERSFITGNRVDDSDGGGHCAGLAVGGASSIRTTTIAGNASSVAGGGICASDSRVKIYHSAIVDNYVADGGGAGITGYASLQSTIVLGNKSCSEGAPPGYCPVADDCWEAGDGTIRSIGSNVVGAGCPTNGPGDISVGPLEVFTKVLGALQNNGGSTLTYNLIPGGPAVDMAGTNCPSPDQRGTARPKNGNSGPYCDSGPVEFDPVLWNNYAFSGGAGTFSATFDGVAHQSHIDGVMGLSAAPAKNANGMATTVRFNTAGLIDARNGDVYAADRGISYTPGKKYRFRLVLNVPQHTYSVFVKPETGVEETLATDFSFRTGQQSVTSLGYWFMKAFVGSHTMNNFNQGYLSTPAFQNPQFYLYQSGRFSMSFNAIPHQDKMNGLIGVAGGPVTKPTHLAAIVRFNPAGKIDARKGSVYAADRSMPYTAGTRYQFRLVVDVLNHTYDVFVRPESGAEVQIAANFAFRTEQQNVSQITGWALQHLVGSHTVEAVTVTELPES